jgi:hypothetical protein
MIKISSWGTKEDHIKIMPVLLERKRKARYLSVPITVYRELSVSVCKRKNSGGILEGAVFFTGHSMVDVSVGYMVRADTVV